MNIKDPGGDAIRLAAALNRYERDGFRDRDDASSGAPDSTEHEQFPGERGLWHELVETYGAESFSLGGVNGGICCITLSSGDLVFYLPDRRTWVWLIFEHVDSNAPDSAADPGDQSESAGARVEPLPTAPTTGANPSSSSDRSAVHREAPSRWRHVANSQWDQPNAHSPIDPNTVTVADMTQVLSSQNTPAAYEEALFVTEGLLLGATYGNRVVPYEELAWVVEAATGHSLHLQSMGRFIGDLVERSYPRHMEVLSALAVSATAPSEPAPENRPTLESELPHVADTGGSSAEASVVDLTGAGMSPTPQNVAGRPS